MRTWQKISVAVLAAVVLTGCGKNPAAAPEAERTIKKTAGIKAAKTVAQPAARSAATLTAPTKAGAQKPGVSTKPGTTGTAPKPATGSTPAAPKPAAEAPATGDGAMRLVIRTWGADPVGSLILQVFSQTDASQNAEIPLQLTGPEARWEQADVPPGRYTVRVKAIGPDGSPMGIASTEAIVEAAAMTDLTIDLGIDTPVPTPKPGGTSGVAGEPSPEPTVAPTTAPTAAPTPAPTPTPAGPGYGGTLGVRVEIL